jgi:choline-sulfatase
LSSASEPYLLRLSYLQPHTPVFPPPPYDNLYDHVPFPSAITHRGSLSAFERRFIEITRADELTPEQVRLAQVRYYGLVAWIDAQVGLLLDCLEASGHIEDTVIVFTADHGASLGENGCYAKQIYAPQVHRVPLLIAQPGGSAWAQVREDICEGLDIPRTLFGLAGITPPAQFKGRDLFDSKPPHAVFSTIGYGYPDSAAFPYLGVGQYYNGQGWPRRACVRTSRYRLDKNVRIDGRPVTSDEADVFLADVIADPDEVGNIAHDPANQTIVRGLSDLLDRHMADRVEPEHSLVRYDSFHCGG